MICRRLSSPKACLHLSFPIWCCCMFAISHDVRCVNNSPLPRQTLGAFGVLVHWILSDLSTFIRYPDPFNYCTLTAGDRNMFYGATGSRLSMPKRERTIQARIEASGLEFLGSQPRAAANRRRHSPTCLPTRKMSRHTTTRQALRRMPTSKKVEEVVVEADGEVVDYAVIKEIRNSRHRSISRLQSVLGWPWGIGRTVLWLRTNTAIPGWGRSGRSRWSTTRNAVSQRYVHQHDREHDRGLMDIPEAAGCSDRSTT